MTEEHHYDMTEEQYTAALVSAYKEGREEGFMEGFLSALQRWVPGSSQISNIFKDKDKMNFQEFRSFHVNYEAAKMVQEKNDVRKSSRL